MATRMQQRRGTAAQWSEVNPTLSAGEIGYETDTGKFKIGDDVNAWDDLPYFLNIEALNDGGALDQYLLSEEVGVSVAQLVDGKVPASQLNLTEYAKTSEVTTAVNNAVSGLVDGAPELLNTLNELAAAVNDDEEFSTTILTELGTKLDEGQLGTTVASLDVAGRVPEGQLFYAIDHTDTQIEQLLEDTIIPLDGRVATLEQLKQDKVTGVSDAEIATLSDISTETTIQAQLNLKASTAQLDAKANASHTHAISDVTDLQNSLDGKANVDHTHSIQQIINLPESLLAKADADHTHVVSDITDITATFSEINYLDGVTSSVQEQLDDKVDKAEPEFLITAYTPFEEIVNIQGTGSATVSGTLGGTQADTGFIQVSSDNVLATLANGTELKFPSISILAPFSYRIQEKVTIPGNLIRLVLVPHPAGVTGDPTQEDGLPELNQWVQPSKSGPQDVIYYLDFENIIVADEVLALKSVNSNIQEQLDSKANATNPQFEITQSGSFVPGGGNVMFGSWGGSSPNFVNVYSSAPSAVQNLPVGSQIIIPSGLTGMGGAITLNESNGSGTYTVTAVNYDSQSNLTEYVVTPEVGFTTVWGGGGVVLDSTTLTIDFVSTSTISAAELGRLDGVTSGIQSQLNGKAATSHTHTVADITDITVDAAAINSLDGAQGNIQDQLDEKSDVDHTHTLSDVVDVTASFTEVNHLVGVTSSIQDQLDSKQDEITGAASSIVSSDLTADRALVTGGNGKVAASGVTKTELEHLTGVTSGIQSQLNGKSANGHTHDIQDISGLIDVTPTEINFLGGAFPVTSSIQSQLNNKASASHTHDIEDVTGLQGELDAKLSLSGGTMTGDIVLAGAPTQALHPATKAYVDGIAEGLHVHASVRVLLDYNIPNLNNGVSTIDGVELNQDDRILIIGQTNMAQNGIYVVAGEGYARAADFDSPAEIDSGDFVFVTEGNTYGGTGWVQTNTVGTIGTDPVEFEQFSGVGTIAAGTNITVVGNQVSTVDNPTFDSVTVSSTLTIGAASSINGLGLDKLSDVAVTSAGMGDTLVHNGTEFVNTHVDNVPTRIKQASISSNAYTLNPAADVGRVIEVFSSSPTTVWIPENDTFHVGTMIVIMQTGSGQVTVGTLSAMATLNSTPGSKLRAQWSVATLLKRSEGVWLLYGDLVA